jgi:hypothetical protein
MLKKILPGVSLAFAALLLNAPCFAQNEIENNQPVVGDLNKKEVAIQKKLQSKYDAGLIDADQLAVYQRDLDGISVKEDELKTRSSGMSDSAKKDIWNKLETFETNLEKQTTSDKSKAKKTN